MSDTVVYEIQPKEIQNSGLEISLLQYEITNTSENQTCLSETIANGAIYRDLPVIADHKLIEFQSDQEVFFKILTSAGVEVIEFTACKNLILACTANYTYKIKNLSGVDANIVWRLYV